MKIPAIFLACLAVAGCSTNAPPQIQAVAAAAPKKGPSVVVQFARPDPAAEHVTRPDEETVRIGDSELDVVDAMGKPLPHIDRVSTADGTTETWRYFGARNSEQYVSLVFVNGVLARVEQPDAAP